MPATVELWPVVALLVTVLLAVLAGFWGLGKIVLAQIDARFASAEAARAAATTHWDRHFDSFAGAQAALRSEIARVEREALEFRAHVAQEYVSRETWLTHTGALSRKLETVLDRLATLVPAAHCPQAARAQD